MLVRPELHPDATSSAIAPIATIAPAPVTRSAWITAPAYGRLPSVRSAVPPLVALVLLAGCADGTVTERDTTPSAPPVTTLSTTTDPPAEPTITVEPTTTAAPTTGVGAPSSGCAADAGVAAPGDSTEDFSAEGLDGTLLLRLPLSYDARTPLPLVIGLHGWSQSAQLLAVQSGLPAAADRHGAVVVLPDITRPVPLWDTSVGGPDARWLDAALDSLLGRFCIDAARVFVTGMSNGAMMTSTWLCTASDRIAAVAPVAGVRVPEGCDPERPVPMMTFHGTDDQYLAYGGGYGTAVAGLSTPDGEGTLGQVTAAGNDTMPVPERAAWWANANGCSGALTAVAPAPADDVTLTTTRACPAPVLLYTVEGGGHTWPGSDFDATIEQFVGATTESVDATELMFAFFDAHPLG